MTDNLDNILISTNSDDFKQRIEKFYVKQITAARFSISENKKEWEMLLVLKGAGRRVRPVRDPGRGPRDRRLRPPLATSPPLPSLRCFPMRRVRLSRYRAPRTSRVRVFGIAVGMWGSGRRVRIINCMYQA